MDLTPDIHISLIQLNQHMKDRALAVLARANISNLDAAGGAFWADILFVTGRSRGSLNTAQLEALSKASAGLGYGATQHALLSTHSVKDGQVSLAEFVHTYARALSAEAIVLLEDDVAVQFSQQISQCDAAENTSALDCPKVSETTKIVKVTNFFASLEAGDNQQEKKRQAWQELQAAKRLIVLP